MSELRLMLDRLRIAVASPDGSVRVTLTVGDLDLVLREGAAASHTERSLARQVEAVLGSAFDGYAEGVARVRGAVAGVDRPVRVEDLPEGHPRRRVMDGIDGLSGTGYSTHDYVSLTWKGRREFTVELRPGSLRRLGEKRMAGELRSAFAAASRERSEGRREVLRSVRNAGSE